MFPYRFGSVRKLSSLDSSTLTEEEYLASSANEGVRKKIATETSTEHVLRALILDESPMVREIALRNPKVTRDMISKTIKHGSLDLSKIHSLVKYARAVPSSFYDTIFERMKTMPLQTFKKYEYKETLFNDLLLNPNLTSSDIKTIHGLLKRSITLRYSVRIAGGFFRHPQTPVPLRTKIWSTHKKGFIYSTELDVLMKDISFWDNVADIVKLEIYASPKAHIISKWIEANPEKWYMIVYTHLTEKYPTDNIDSVPREWVYQIVATDFETFIETDSKTRLPL